MLKKLLLIMIFAAFSLQASAQEATEEAVLEGEILFINSETGEYVVTIMDATGEILRTIPEMRNQPVYMRWSPDGSEIAYVARGASGQEVFVIKSDGSDLRQLTDNNTRELLPVWSPDGSEIVFSSTRAGNIQLFIMNAEDGSNVRQITDDVATYYATDWHISGEWLAATKIVEENSEVVLINILNGEELAFTAWDSTDGGGRWSPDGTRFVWYSTMTGYAELFMVDFEASLERLPILGPETDFVQQLTFPVDGWVGHSYFSWSPDGRYLAIDVLSDNVAPFGTSAEPNLEQNIHLLNLETGEETVLTTNDNSAIPEWRP